MYSYIIGLFSQSRCLLCYLYVQLVASYVLSFCSAANFVCCSRLSVYIRSAAGVATFSVITCCLCSCSVTVVLISTVCSHMQ